MTSAPLHAADPGVLDHYARLVCLTVGVPTGLVTLVGADEQVFLGAQGLAEPWQTARRTPLSHSLCQYVVADARPLVISDTRTDSRAAGNLAVTELGVVAYAGWPVTDHVEGAAPVGSLCAIDSKPHTWTRHELDTLADLAAACSAELAQRRLAQELVTLSTELERSNELLTALGAQVSHDLQNPLTALAATLELLDELLRAPDPDLDEMGALVSRGLGIARRMADLVRDVLAYAVAGGELVLGDTDVRSLLDTVLDDTPGLAGTVTVGELAPAYADGQQLRILLQNLVGNAAKHAGGSGIEVEAWVADELWVLEVVDHGPGVPEPDRERVFEPYERLGSRVAGSGMGLATCHRIVLAHRGRIELLETPGGGTTVRVTVPAGPSAGPARH